MPITSTAYLKPLLHAAKYPSSPVFGLLIGIKTKGPRPWLITDSVLLFHTHVLAPMLELAFIQTEEYCRCLSSREHKKYRILGCYVANERVADLEMHVMTRRVAARINLVTGGRAVVLVLDNTKLAKPVNAFRTMLPVDKHWRLASESEEYVPPARAFTDLPDLIRKDYEREVSDFEDHLSNPSKDYFNVGLLTEREEDVTLKSSAQVVPDDDEEEEYEEDEEEASPPPEPTPIDSGDSKTTSSSGNKKPEPTVVGNEDDID